jgi:ribosomal protein S27AE
MEKLGVHEDETLQKEADQKQGKPKCPRCGSEVEQHGNVLKCPKCGTEPFEKKD